MFETGNRTPKKGKKKERSKDCAKLQNGAEIIIPNGLVIRPFRGGVAGALQVIALLHEGAAL